VRVKIMHHLDEIIPVESLPPDVRRRISRMVEADEAAAKAGTLKMMEFTADSPAEAAARRLRSILAKRGISQKQLAQMLGVTPAVVNRVLKKPDRSKVATLRRMADALHVELREIV
jgi:ribosome-binding protein aMBF1 (putative translation factor)